MEALWVLEDGPIPAATGLQANGIQRRTMTALCDDGLARYFPFGKPPNYRITPEGRRAALAAAGNL